MRAVIIVQARMSSTRLPGKVLMDLAGSPMLLQVLRRLQRSRLADQIVVATTRNPADDPVVEVARLAGAGWFRGCEQDVLSRYLGAARQYHADVIVRVTADCPLIDPHVTDCVIRELVEHEQECDYASNLLVRTYPRGLDVEAMFLDVLLRVDRLARSPAAREHVTAGIYSERPSLFLCRSLVDGENDNSDLRWTVDTPEDMRLARALYEQLNLCGNEIAYRDIISHVRSRPELGRLNAGIETWNPRNIQA